MRKLKLKEASKSVRARAWARSSLRKHCALREAHRVSKPDPLPLALLLLLPAGDTFVAVNAVYFSTISASPRGRDRKALVLLPVTAEGEDGEEEEKVCWW